MSRIKLPRPLDRAIAQGLRLLALCIGLPLVVATALIERYRRRPGEPRIVWGTAPVINMKYHSRAARLMGYESETVVESVMAMHRPEDCDWVTSDPERRPFGRMRAFPPLLRANLDPYRTLAWAIRRFDVFVYYSSSTALRHTPAKFLELQLLKLARKRLVLLAYGADVHATTRMKGLLFKHALSMDYPEFVRHPEETLRTLHYCSRYADHIVSGVDWVEYMPWWDSLTCGHFAIDTEEWKPSPRPFRPGETIKVLHAPNHREIKGTRFLIEACEELQAEGYPIELQVVEGVPNERLRELMRECDIIADQFIMGWYALFAIEGMALGKPVLCYLRPDLLELYTLYSFAGGCPVFDTPPLQIKDRLRELVEDPQLRAELGEQGRRYVEAHHSLESVGRMFDGIFERVYRSSAQRR
jgi:glycosyltransferase involved in cell wall biosynthesis